MTFLALTPGQFAALVGGGTAWVTALYLIRLRRREALVPFGPLWDEVLQAERRVNPLRRLRPLISLLLQVAWIALAALALAEPRPGTAPARRRIAILLDTSASMGAAADGGSAAVSRFDQARAAARRIIAGLRTGDAALLIAAESVPRVICRWTGSQRALLDALDALAPTDGHADWSAAFDCLSRKSGDSMPELQPERGDDLPMRSPDFLHVLIVTDAGGPSPDEVAAHLGAGAATVRRFGAPGDNAAITAFDARPSPADPLRAEVYIEIASFADRRMEGTLRIFAGDVREPVEVLRVALEPGARWRRIIRGDPATIAPGPLRAELDLPDVLPADNLAYAFLPPAPRLSVELVADTPDFFLQQAIAAHPNVTVRTVAPADYRPRTGVVPIFLECVPDTPPTASAIYLRPPPGRSPVAADGVLERALITAVNTRHPLLRRVSLDDCEVFGALALRPRPTDEVLVRSVDQALMVARPLPEGGTLVVMGFMPASSDLPLRVAFPVLMANVLHWLGGQTTADTPRTFPVGQGVSVPFPIEGREALVTFLAAARPAVEERAIVHDGTVRLTPQRTGFYRVAGGGLSRALAVNVVDPRESDLRPPAPTPAGDAKTPVEDNRWHTELPAEGSAMMAARDLWPTLLVVVLVLTTVEWFTYQRRWTV